MKAYLLKLLIILGFLSCNQKGSSAFSELLAAFLQYTPQEQRTFHSTFSAPVDPNLVLDTQPVMLLSPVDNDLPKAQFGFPPNSVRSLSKPFHCFYPSHRSYYLSGRY